jgi:hypothetical protein
LGIILGNPEGILVVWEINQWWSSCLCRWWIETEMSAIGIRIVIGNRMWCQVCQEIWGIWAWEDRWDRRIRRICSSFSSRWCSIRWCNSKWWCIAVNKSNNNNSLCNKNPSNNNNKWKRNWKKWLNKDFHKKKSNRESSYSKSRLSKITRRCRINFNRNISSSNKWWWWCSSNKLTNLNNSWIIWTQTTKTSKSWTCNNSSKCNIKIN